MTDALKAVVGNGSNPSGRGQRDRTIETVCMALALASAVLLIRAISLL
jgi:hypothetical protein